MKLLIKFLVFVNIVFLTACASNQSKLFSKIRPQMEKADVVELVGSPSTSQRSNGFDLWIYRYYINKEKYTKKVYFSSGFVVRIIEESARPEFEKEQKLESYLQKKQKQNSDSGFRDIDSE